MERPALTTRYSLHVDILATGASPLARLEGELDAASAPRLIAAIEPVLRNGASSLVLDCSALCFCDSTGLRALLTLHKMLPEGETISLVRTNDTLRAILRITALDTLFEVS